MSVTNNHSNSNEWSKYLILAFICAMVSIEGISDVIADTDETLMTQSSKEKEIPFVVRSENVATRLGGFFGIHAFLKNPPNICPNDTKHKNLYSNQQQ